jgi:outer membrane protein
MSRWWPGLSRSRGRALAVLCLVAATLGAEASPPVLDLQTCVAEASAAGPDFGLAAANLAVARATRDQAAAKNAFGLGTSAGLTRSVSHTTYTAPTGSVQTLAAANTSDSPQAALSLTGPLSTSLGLAATQVIPEAGNVDEATRVSLNLSSTLWDGYAGGRALAGLRQADFSLASSDSQAGAARRQAVYAVKQAYYGLLAQQRQIEILSRTLEARSEDEARTRALYEARGASGIDIKQAEYNRIQASLDLRKARAGLVAARQRLSALIGRPLDNLYTVREVEALPPAPPEAAAAVAAALSSRAELWQLELQEAAGRVALDLAKGQYSPTLSATGNLSLTQNWTMSRNSADWSLGLQLSYPLIDSGTLDAQRRQALYQNEAYSLQRAQLVASVSTEVQAAVDSLADLLDRVALAQKGLELAQAQYELARTQFELGKGSNLDLLDASVALTSAEAALSSARSDAQLGDLALQNALGN